MILPLAYFTFQYRANALKNGGHHSFGIDWEALDNQRLGHHYTEHNPEDASANQQLFFIETPNHLSHVSIPEPDCPLD
jgi:hypothetical protein